ncbi:hypothetical protein AN7097.2 [Aspergillus nidulans FGSC A4]|uniref:MFS alpha-glucoside transporter, putative (AFU_orthologue AFUA_5G00500) n=1 Tax=Emericella nidulans (strain FGSC A4 / ATCC 38163 / CBS 112.46 / NRRL 194 / M139) TaxID=227321 RepID=Q5AX83_EMENI|nr:hypothetical protein [Aspergillus nidulans FGSC A4]EAA61302.1 hypothetical protein AN7097.2 [Aspergillus nidulans FGSC A4]CBF79088.1 TPA: MFS alpha-glucoside transporter, putative (AFU_orthologue; AFUA_5G00500) [Aspergillus nidulans FGSC A4]|eukprot:XP_664701.1 hypothetical protein AN7097.2 [Aspergillus nidulans FGSC A4]
MPNTVDTHMDGYGSLKSPWCPPKTVWTSATGQFVYCSGPLPVGVEFNHRACEIVSTFIYAPLLWKHGRKSGILVASAISVAGLLQQLATHWRVHLTGRGGNGNAIGMMFTISPLWTGETCRPELRGFFLCFFNTSIVLGQFAMFVFILAVPVNCNGGYQSSGCISFQVISHPAATAQQLTFPAIPRPAGSSSPSLRTGSFETERHRKPGGSLQRVYGSKNEAFYGVEVRRIESENHQALAIQASLAQFSRHTFLGLDLWPKLSASTARAASAPNGHLRRQWPANDRRDFVIGYTTYFLDLIGVKDYFDASIILYVLMLLDSMAAFPLTEIIGRRTMIVVPQFWAIIYQLSIGSVGFILASESLRSTTHGLVTITNAAWGLIMQFTIPYMTPKSPGLQIQTQEISAPGWVHLPRNGSHRSRRWMYLYPETKGISFEAMDELYASGTMPRHFRAPSEQRRGGSSETKTEPPVHVEELPSYLSMVIWPSYTERPPDVECKNQGRYIGTE